MINIIPVIDLKNGRVVHARQGNRDLYQPIDSELCRSSDIFQVIRAFMTVYDFKTFYIADLNALGHQGNHDRLIDEVTTAFSEKIFWVDRGSRQSFASDVLPGNHMPVMGSESFSPETIQAIKTSGKPFILSLDYTKDGELGAKTLFFDPDYWPETIIIMTLARVGSYNGPDIPLLSEFCRRYPDKNFIAAGGIRNKQDLIDLKKIGIEQSLIASALHSGTLGSDDIAELQMP